MHRITELKEQAVSFFRSNAVLEENGVPFVATLARTWAFVINQNLVDIDTAVEAFNDTIANRYNSWWALDGREVRDMRDAICSSLASSSSPFLDELKQEMPDWTDIENEHIEYARKASIAYRSLISSSPMLAVVPEELKQTSIDELNLTAGPYNNLKRVGIELIGDLIEKTGAELLKIPTFGKLSLRQVEESLSARGLSLKVA